ncbi:MAG TPA: hypothetical protein VKS80_14955, partial [Trinickia sp.]|nr:hypothetical protein [Trinickia sp.]
MRIAARHLGAASFDALQSDHEEETRRLEAAIASNCETLRSRLHELTKQVEFRRQPHTRKLGDALWYGARQMYGGHSDCFAAREVLTPSQGVARVAGVLASWLGLGGTPLQRVTGIVRAD